MMTHELTKIFSFDTAHRLSFHSGKCKNLHGHTYRLEISISGERDSNGLIMDFGDLKRIVNDNIIQILDHATVIYEKDSLLLDSFPKSLKHVVLPYESTAENMCVWIYEKLEHAGLTCKQVSLWETPTSKAIYTK